MPFDEVGQLPTFGSLVGCTANTARSFDRCSRNILDYAYSGADNETAGVVLANRGSHVTGLSPILYRYRLSPDYGLIYFAKTDIADGYYTEWEWGSVQTTHQNRDHFSES